MAIKRVGNITINYTVPEAQTQLYNAIGRTAGNQAATQQNTNQGGGDNFFTKRGRSIENAFGTTGSAIVSAVNDRIENDRIERDRKDARKSMNDIAKKYGFNSWSDWQDANAAARESGDTEAIKRFDAQLKEFQAQANANAAKANKKAANYEDYRKNDYISNKINQDRGKFAGSAINTLSTAVDVTGLGATPVTNAIQGGIEGVADELEQNGFENFDWGRAGQNAAIGATTGAVTGALNAGISNSLAKRAAAKGLTNTATKAGLGSALKNGARTIATGAARGALSGAVGGATGAGLQSALNGVEFGQGVQNALQGAVQGAQQGAVTGGIMAGANAAFGKTNFGKQLQNAKTNWDQSGRNFDERLTNTLTSGDSAVGDWLMNRRQSRVLGAAGNLGNRVQDISDTYRTVDPLGNRREYTPDQVRQLIDEYENYKAPEVLSSNSTDEVTDAMGEAGVTLSEIFRNRNGGQFDPYSRADGEAFNKWVQQTKADLSTPTTASLARGAGYNNEAEAWEAYAKYKNDLATEEYQNRLNSYNAAVEAKDGDFSYNDKTGRIIDVDNRYMPPKYSVDELNEWLLSNQQAQTPTTAKGTVRLYRGLEQEYDPNYPSSKLDTNGYESWTDNPELAKQYGKNVYYIDVPESDIQGSYLDENPNSPTYGDRYPLYKTTKAAGLNGISGNEYQLEVGSDYQKGLTYTPLEGTDTPTTAKGWAKKAGERIVEDINNKGTGLSIKDITNKVDDIRTKYVNHGAINRLADALENGSSKDVKFTRLTKDIINDANAVRTAQGVEPLSDRQVKAYKNALPHLAKRVSEGMSAQDAASIAYNALTNPDAFAGATELSKGSSTPIIALDENGRYNQALLNYASTDGGTSLKSIIPNATDSQIKRFLSNKESLLGTAGVADPASLSDEPNARATISGRRANSIITQNDNNINYPDDIRNMQINRNDMIGYEDDNTAPITTEEALARAGINRNNNQRPQTVSQVAQVDPWDRVAQEAGYSNYDEVLQRYAEANPNAKINPRGMAGQVLTWMDQNPNTPTTAAGWAKRAGQRAVEDINNSNLGLKVQDVSQDDPSKRLYNALVGNQEPVAEAEIEADTDMGVVPSKTSKEGKLRYARGKELLRQYGTVDQPMARASRAVESVQEIADAGFTKPEDVERIANVITGSNGEVSKLTRNLIKNAAPVDTFAGENGQTIEDFIDNSIQLNSLYDTNKGKAVKQTIEANLRSLPSRAAGSVTYTDNPEDVFKVVQNLEASAAELEGRGGSRYFRPTVENIHQAAVLKDTASLLKQRLFDGADVKQALTPEVAQNLKSYDPNNKKYADWVDNTIMKAESINDLRAAQAPFVRMSKYIDNAYTQAATVGGRMAENANDLSRILTTRNGLLKAGIDTLWNSNAARRGRAAVYDKLADRAADQAANTPDTAAGWAKQAGKRAAEDLGNTNLGNRIQDVSGQPVNPQVATPAELANTVADYNPSTQLYNAIGRTEGTLAQETPAQYLANAAQEAEIVSPMEAPIAPTNEIATSMGNASTATYNALTGTPTTVSQPTTGSINTGYYQPTGDYWTDIIASAMSAAIDANDVNAFASLFGMYQDQMANLQKQTSSEKDYSNPMNWSSADRTKLLSAQNAMGQIDQLEEAYNQATGGEGSNAVQGWLRSRASDISGGNWDPSAANYNSLSESVGMGIVKNLINLGVTEADAQRYLKYLPALTDTKEQAAQKLDTLRGIYQNQINNLYGAYGL